MSKKIVLSAPVVTAASQEAVSQEALDKAARAFMGNTKPGGKPHAARYETLSLSVRVGHIMGKLGIAQDKALLVLDKATHEGEGKAKTGQSRRTKAEQQAYQSAATALSRLCSRAGIVSPLQHKRNQNAPDGAAKTGKAKGGSKVKAGQGKAKATSSNVVAMPTQKLAKREDVYAYFETTAATMLMVANKKADIVNGEIGALINRFKLELSSLIVGETK